MILKKFSAKWCSSCRVLQTAWEKLQVKYTDVQFESIDADAEPATLQALGIMSIPTVIFMKDDVEVGRIVGAQRMADYEKIIEEKK